MYFRIMEIIILLSSDEISRNGTDSLINNYTTKNVNSTSITIKDCQVSLNF